MIKLMSDADWDARFKEAKMAAYNAIFNPPKSEKTFIGEPQKIEGCTVVLADTKVPAKVEQFFENTQFSAQSEPMRVEWSECSDFTTWNPTYNYFWLGDAESPDAIAAMDHEQQKFIDNLTGRVPMKGTEPKPLVLSRQTKKYPAGSVPKNALRDPKTALR